MSLRNSIASMVDLFHLFKISSVCTLVCHYLSHRGFPAAKMSLIGKEGGMREYSYTVGIARFCMCKKSALLRGGP